MPNTRSKTKQNQMLKEAPQDYVAPPPPPPSKQQKQLALELHQPSRRRFQRRRVITNDSQDLYEIDLVEMQALSKYNRGYRYYLALINTFNKMGYIAPLKSKKGPEVALAFQQLIKDNNLVMRNLSSDMGKEFYNAQFQAVVKKYNINHYSTFTEIKCSIVERWNRTIKEKLYKRFTEENTLNWTNGLLRNVVDAYNRTKHSSIGMKPIDVNKNTEDLVRMRLATSKTSIKKPKYKVGEWVRISRWQKGIFSKSYEGNWSEQLFKIRAIKNTVPITYLLVDSHGEELKPSFYEIELKPTKVEDYFRIDKIIAKRVNKDGSVDLKVTKKGYDSKYYFWIPESKTESL